jgi:hypothetical protein
MVRDSNGRGEVVGRGILDGTSPRKPALDLRPSRESVSFQAQFPTTFVQWKRNNGVFRTSNIRNYSSLVFVHHLR